MILRNVASGKEEEKNNNERVMIRLKKKRKPSEGMRVNKIQ